MDDFRKKFRQGQYKLTSQRQIVLQTFLDHQDEHLSAEEVHSILRQKSNEIGLATVYRTLELLSELGVLQKMDFGDGRSRYEVISDADMHQHHHLICLTCGKVREFEDDLLDNLETAIARKSNFMITDHQLKFYGYCQECQAANKKL
ncbi:MAG: transcriptional repressor [Pelosinus sp.]|nr:transcriptional repressor [Pelosinus sp.]